MPVSVHHRRRLAESALPDRGRRLLLVWGVWLWACLAASAAPTILGLPATLDAEYDLTWTLQVSGTGSAPLQVEFEQACRLTLTPTRWRCAPSAAPRSATRTGALALHPGATYTLTLKRRRGTVGLLVDHRLLGSAPAPAAARGRIRFTRLPAWARLTEVRYQPVEPPRFGDDFMRPESWEQFLANRSPWSEDTIWQVAYYRRAWPGQDPRDPTTARPLTNPWQLGLLPNTRMTPNGFWLLYTGAGPSWVVTQPTVMPSSWDRYTVAAAVQPEYDSAVGLIAAYQDNRHYLLFRWTAATTSGTGQATLSLIDGDTTRVLATVAGGFRPRQWYTLRLNVGWETIEALVDDRLLMAAPNPGYVEGRVGLYADGAAQPRVPAEAAEAKAADDDPSWALQSLPCISFDDVRVGPWEDVPDLLHDARYARETRGQWSPQDQALVARGSGQWLGGPTHLTHYALTASILLPPGGSAGLLSQVDARGHGYVWVLSEHRQQLFDYGHGRPGRVLAATAAPLPAGQWLAVRLDVEGAYAALSCDGRRLLEGYDPRRRGGRVGLLACAPGVRVRACRVTAHDAVVSRVALAESLSHDPWVNTWASQDACWTPAVPPADARTPLGRPHTEIGAAAPYATEVPGWYWHHGRHYHDVAVALPLSRRHPDGQQVALTTAADPAAGYRLALSGDGAAITASVYRHGRRLAQYAVDPARWTDLVFARRGSFLLVSVCAGDEDATAARDGAGGRLLGVYRDPEPLPVTQVGVAVTEAAVPARRVQVTSDWRQDLFTTAPVEWETAHGVWGVLTRYKCDPRWNWFGGYGATTPTAWSKTVLVGDQSVEAYLGVKMEYDAANEPYARRFRDLNLSICTDGREPDSGYTLARARMADGHPVTQLRRRGVVVWSSTAPADLLPAHPDGHRQWFAVRLVKQGARIEVYLDHRRAGSYVDPDPLPGGRMALWTVNNGIAIGRVNLAAEVMRPWASTAEDVDEKGDRP